MDNERMTSLLMAYAYWLGYSAAHMPGAREIQGRSPMDNSTFRSNVFRSEAHFARNKDRISRQIKKTAPPPATSEGA